MTVSVCIPTYNQASYIEQAILSAVNQTVKPFEIIVCDDSSTDETSIILKKLSGEIPTLKVFIQPHNLGISANADYCLRLATGDYIVRLDSDDLLLPQYIEKLAILLNKFPGAGYAHAAVNEIDEHGNLIRERMLWRTSEFLNGDAALKVAAQGYKVAANIIMFRKTALKEADYVSLKINFCEDYYLSAQIAANGYGNIYYPGFLSCYRVWNNRGKVSRKIAEIMGLTAVFDEVLEPAFIKRGWNTLVIKRHREKFAAVHADSLGFKGYSLDQKLDLKTNILKLSGTRRTKIYLWLYENNFGPIITFYNNGMKKVKLSGKNAILKLFKKKI